MAGRFGGSAIGFVICLALSSGGHSIGFDGRFIRFYGFVLIVFFVEALFVNGNCDSLLGLLPTLRPELLRSELYGLGMVCFFLTMGPLASGALTFGGVYFG